MVHCTDDIRVVPLPRSTDVLTDVLRAGAQKLLAQAIDAEVADWIDSHQHCLDAHGHRQVVRNGHAPARTITTGVGPVEVRQPRVRDRRPAEEAEKFSSKILPPYLRKPGAVTRSSWRPPKTASQPADFARPWLGARARNLHPESGVASGKRHDGLAMTLGRSSHLDLRRRADSQVTVPPISIEINGKY